jgi:hypothetical protein
MDPVPREASVSASFETPRLAGSEETQAESARARAKTAMLFILFMSIPPGSSPN